jgi:hypothetical protein
MLSWSHQDNRGKGRGRAEKEQITTSILEALRSYCRHQISDKRRQFAWRHLGRCQSVTIREAGVTGLILPREILGDPGVWRVNLAGSALRSPSRSHSVYRGLLISTFPSSFPHLHKRQVRDRLSTRIKMDLAAAVHGCREYKLHYWTEPNAPSASLARCVIGDMALEIAANFPGEPFVPRPRCRGTWLEERRRGRWRLLGHWAGFCGLLFLTVALITTPAASSQTFFAASASFLLPHARSSGCFAITFSTTFYSHRKSFFWIMGL